jgi:hypothetical protein
MTRPYLIALLLATAACSGHEDHREGSAPSTSQNWSALKDFTAIDATGPDDIVVTIGPQFSVTAHGDARLIDRLDIRTQGDRLVIGRKSDKGSFWGDQGDVTVRVTMPLVSAVSLTGSGDLDLDRAEGKSIDLSLTGSGDMAIRTVKVDGLTADLTGSGGISMAGAAKEARLAVTGSGDFAAEGLRADKAGVRVLGSGNVDFASDGPVDIDILGSGDVTVKGNAQCRVNSAGSGEAHCGR